MSTETPTRIATVRPLTLCSFTSMRWGFSPGAWVLDMTVTAETWATDRTVAAHIHGAPINPQPTFVRHISTISKWKPEPFFNFLSFLSMMSL